MSSRTKRLISFYFLTFVLLGFVPLLHRAAIGGAMDFSRMAARASAATGVPWDSNLVNIVRLCSAEPGLWLLVFGSAVPSLSAILVILVTGVPPWRAIGRRFLPAGSPVAQRGRGTILLSYATIFAIIVPALVVVSVVRKHTGGSYDYSGQAFSVALVAALFAAAFLDQGAVLEEFGWRGFAAHELQAGLMRPAAAALSIGLCWGLWHVPRDVTTGVVERLGIVSYLFLYLPAFVGGTMSVSVIAAYFMNRLQGSLIPAIIVHGLTNDAVGLSGITEITTALTPYHQATKALPLAVVAVFLIVQSRGRLGLVLPPPPER